MTFDHTHFPKEMALFGGSFSVYGTKIFDTLMGEPTASVLSTGVSGQKPEA